MKPMSIILALSALVALGVGAAAWGASTPTPQLFLPPAATTTPVASSTPAEPASQLPAASAASAFKATMTTYFFVGEPADASNDFIQNSESFWDEEWKEHFGGADDPSDRCGYRPCGFTPLENPFYFALPYADYDQNGDLKPSAHSVPWYRPGMTVVLKNHWIEVTHNGHTCYGQWEDVGPDNEDDFAYVFGSSLTPTNTFGEKAGLDVSPALWDCLGMADNDITSWKFVDESAVPAGPWKDIVTSSGSTWAN